MSNAIGVLPIPRGPYQFFLPRPASNCPRLDCVARELFSGSRQGHSGCGRGRHKHPAGAPIIRGR